MPEDVDDPAPAAGDGDERPADPADDDTTRIRDAQLLQDCSRLATGRAQPVRRRVVRLANSDPTLLDETSVGAALRFLAAEGGVLASEIRRPRGRPRKLPQQPSSQILAAAAADAAAAFPSVTAAGAACAPGRRRGRPPLTSSTARLVPAAAAAGPARAPVLHHPASTAAPGRTVKRKRSGPNSYFDVANPDDDEDRANVFSLTVSFLGKDILQVDYRRICEWVDSEPGCESAL